jgi:hypothetical protein
MLPGGAETAGDRDASSGSVIRVFGTNRERPGEGRIFVLTKMGWLERLEGSCVNQRSNSRKQIEPEARPIRRRVSMSPRRRIQWSQSTCLW